MNIDTIFEQALHHLFGTMAATIAPAAIIVVVVILLLVDRQSKRNEYFRNLR